MNYVVNRKLLRPPTVSYQCPHCHDNLTSPLVEAGTTQHCPGCKKPFETPGIHEKDEGQKRATRNRLYKDDLKQQKAQRKLRRSQPPPPNRQPPPPPQMVWYGRMQCPSCGYQWQARRSTPPAKCAGCGSRNVRTITEPQRVFPDASAGCALTLLFFVGPIAAAAIGLRLWIR